jgi:hypothetical protein
MAVARIVADDILKGVDGRDALRIQLEEIADAEPGNIGTADVELDEAPTLASLSAVAQYLSDMMTRLNDGAAPGHPDDEALFRTNDGHGHRVIVEQVKDGYVAITIRTSQDRHDAQTAVLSREDAIALREALEGI